MTVAEVKAPELDVLVGGASRKQCAIGRDIHTDNGKLVTVQREKKFQGVGIEHLGVSDMNTGNEHSSSDIV